MSIADTVLNYGLGRKSIYKERIHNQIPFTHLI